MLKAFEDFQDSRVLPCVTPWSYAVGTTASGPVNMSAPWPSLTLLPPWGSKVPGVVSARRGRRIEGWGTFK